MCDVFFHLDGKSVNPFESADGLRVLVSCQGQRAIVFYMPDDDKVTPADPRDLAVSITANLEGAALSGANLSKAKLNDADLTYAKLPGANFSCWASGCR